MPNNKTTTFRIVAATFMFVAAAGTASADALIQVSDISNPAFAQVIGPTSTPIGHAEFCKTHRDECGRTGREASAVQLTDRLWEQLVNTNNRMNTDIVPVTDADLYKVGEFWTYPRGYGDCEDIALAKRRALIEDGWDPSALLMAVVRERNGNGHAVLMVRTDRGDLILDNQDGYVRLWSETPYHFIKRQSQDNAGEWVSIDDSRTVLSVASAN
jgi:predicted transglutaminase-like cysteine proteinase